MHDYINKKRAEGMNISHLALIIAAYVRTVAEDPQINRFIGGNHRAYARNEIAVGMVVLKKGTERTMSKIYFDQEDTIFDVNRKLMEYVDQNRETGEINSTDAAIRILLSIPGLASIGVGLFRLLDHFGLLPRPIVKVSPFHTSMVIANLASIRTNHIYHHVYQFGTTGQTIAMGNMREMPKKNKDGTVSLERCLPLGVVMDERICSGSYYAMAFACLRKYLKEPALLEEKPEKVIREYLKPKKEINSKRKSSAGDFLFGFLLKKPGRFGTIIFVKVCKVTFKSLIFTGGIIMTIEERYARWLERTADNKEINDQLKSYDAETISDCFYRDLEFGTGGLRSKIAAGPNRMNVYTVARASQGMAQTIGEGGKIAIAYDSRIKSDVFARTAASVFAANGITAYIFKTLMPTPTLSYAVRELKCDAGVVVTASHNPAVYNGYKAYGPDGCQFTLELAEKTLANILATDEFDGVKSVDFEQGLKDGSIVYIDDSLLEKFIDNVVAQTLQPGLPKEVGLKVVYSPFNGTGNVPVRKALARLGVQCDVVKEQELPDGNFPTIPYPNPEIRENFKMAEELALKLQPDLLLATDPDCDRVGIAGRNRDGSFTLMNGNEVGLMLMEYVLSTRKAQGTLPKDPVVIKTIVTADLAYEIAAAYGAEVIDTLTGFKFIGEQMSVLADKGEGDRFVIGFEESYGYLGGLYARDKDAVFASTMICEMAADLKKKDITIPEYMESIYKKYGYCLHELLNYGFEGQAGMEKMKRIMASFRAAAADGFADEKAIGFADYKESYHLDIASGEKEILTLPKSDVLTFELTGGLKFLVRPSGTEPKMKAYLVSKAPTYAEAQKGIERLTKAVTDKVNSVD